MAFLLGRIVTTPSIITLIDNANLDLRPFIVRHLKCDFGSICSDSIAKNNTSIKAGAGNVLSQYSVSDGVYIWISTELNGLEALTTILSPSDD